MSNGSQDGEAPKAWMRRWAFDGVKPQKVFDQESRRWKWPAEMKVLPITQGKIFPDDVPLFAQSERRDTIAIAALQRALTMQTGGIFNHMTAPPELAARCSCPQCVRECVEAALGKLGANHEPAKGA